MTRYGVGWRACVTAAVRELMLLTLGDEVQTGTKTREYGGWERGNYKKGMWGGQGWRQLFHCRGNKNTQSKWGLDDGGICVY